MITTSNGINEITRSDGAMFSTEHIVRQLKPRIHVSTIIVSLFDTLSQPIDELTQYYLVDEKREELSEDEEEIIEIELIEIPFEEAKEKILVFVNEHPGVTTTEVVFELGLDPILVNRVLHSLEREGKLRGRDV